MKNLFAFLLIISFLQRTNAQVNVQTGSATFTLPMFSWQDDKSRLGSAIALNYNSGNGLKVSDVASNIGQGWNLMAGGVVTRIQAGEPDDQYPVDGSVEDVRKYPPGYLYTPSDLFDGCPTAMTRYPLFKDKNHLYKQHNAVAVDKELDHFAFQMNGKSGVFIVKKDAILNHRGSGVTLGDSKFIIEFVEQIEQPHADYPGNTSKYPRTTIVEFDIRDDNGLIYRFSKLEKTKVLTTSYCTADLQQELKQPHFKHGNVYNEAGFDNHNLYNPYVINSWYLTEIEDALTLRKITFNYGETRNINNTAGTSLAYYAGKDYTMISRKTSITETPALTNIIYPDGHQANFIYGENRIDFNGDKILSSIDVMYGGRYLSRYKLNSSYFILNRYGTPVTPNQKSVARLCLLSIQKYGVDLKATEPPYDFDYYQGSSDPNDYVPPPFFHIKDIWGYYNADYSHDYDNDVPVNLTVPITSLTNNQLKGLCFLRKNVATPQYYNSRPGYAKNGLLRMIAYPTGSKLTYDYEQNTAMVRFKDGANIAKTEKVIGGVHVSKTSLTDGGYSNDCDHPIVTNYTYRLEKSNAQEVDKTSLWGVEDPRNRTSVATHYAPEDKHLRFKPITVTCDYRYMNPGIQSMDQSVSLSTMQQVLVTFSNLMDIVSAVLDVVDVINLLDATPGALVAVIIDIIATVATFTISCLSDLSRDEVQTIYYNSDLNSANPLPGQFKRVEITESSGQHGKTVQEFTSEDQYSIWAENNDELSMKQRFAYWAYGLPLSTKVFDAAGNLLKETVNEYDTTKAGRFFSVKYILGYDCYKCEVLKVSSQKSPDWISMTGSVNVYGGDPETDLKAHYYRIKTGRVELLSTSDRTYKPGTLDYQEVLTKYQYNQNNYQVSDVATVQSNGDETTKHIRYSIDYSGDVMGTLNANNMVSLPVSTTESIQKKGSNVTQYLGKKVTEYVQRPGGDIKPARIREQRMNQPGTLSAYDWPADAGVAGDSKYHDIQTFTYDGHDNLIGMKDEGSHVVTNIYGYSDKYVVASVINADPSIDISAYTSFEDGDNLGGWTKGGTSGVLSGNSVTGLYYLPLTAGNSLSVNFPALLPQLQKPYTLSFWATNSSVGVTGNATLIKSGPSLNGYTYYEYGIAAGTQTVSLSGNANIDELRLYPKTARMRTVSYDPLIGKTSECDENNRITYYEYDEMGRLRFVKDDSHNILKMYEYNYASKRASDCNVTYYNYKITEIFRSDNCGAGYIATPVFVTVDAGAYSSTISKADADQKAEAYLMSMGQSYANSLGHCLQVFTNGPLSQVFIKDNCAVGSVGGTYTYSVPAGKYTALTQEDADQMAQDEIDANGQVYANMDGNGACTVSTEPIWEAPENAQYRCQTNTNGTLTGHQEIQVTDVNPNSSSNPRTQWKDVGVNTASCSAPVAVYAKVFYENVVSTANGTYADVVVRFFSDAQCTTPTTVSNLSVNYDRVMACVQTPPYGTPPNPGVISGINGSYGIIAQQITIEFQESWNEGGTPHTTQCNIRFYLDGAYGYIVAQ